MTTRERGMAEEALRDDEPREEAATAQRWDSCEAHQIRPSSVSVVMPARNAATTIGTQLEALSRQQLDRPWELLVVDNGSTDGTSSIVMSYVDRLPSVRVVAAHELIGVNAARNAGIAVASGEVILLCDADDEVNDGWLSAMVAALSEAAAVGGSLEFEKLNDARILPRSPRGASHAALRFLPYAIGANCGFRRDVWQSLGGFDPSYAGGGDEVDFFWRLQLTGYELVYSPHAIVSYRLPASIWSGMRSAYIKGRASARLYHEYRGLGARFEVSTAVRYWIGLFLRSYRILGTTSMRRQWLIRLAQQTGRALGGLRSRLLYF